MIKNSIFDDIYSYYPVCCSFESMEYQNSNKYRKYLDLIEDNSLKEKIDKMAAPIIRSVYPNNSIKKWSNKEKPSVHYTILLKENQPLLDDDIELINVLKGTRWDLDLYVSLITYTYYCKITETILNKGNWDFKIYDVKEIIKSDKLNFMNKKFREHGYIRLEREEINKVIPNLETELHEEGKVKLFHCLFSDIESNF